MKFYSSSLVLALTLSTLMVISSSSWIVAWVGLEINLMVFIPLLLTNSSPSSSESAIKYFIAQALASLLIIFPSILTLKTTSFPSLSDNHDFILLALATKLGMAPTHFWFPQVMETMKWSESILLLTWQKIAPFYLLSSSPHSTGLPIVIVLSALAGAAGGFNTSSLKKIIAYSSIAHMSWMASTILLNMKSWMLYFLIYSTLTLSIVLLLTDTPIESIGKLHLFPQNKTMKLLIFLNLMSLGGMPPTLGFAPSANIVIHLMNTMNPTQAFIALILIFSSMTTLFFYTKISYSSIVLVNWNPYSKMFPPSLKNSFTLFLSSLSLLGLLIIHPLVLLS